jgi:hypothetical protein
LALTFLLISALVAPTFSAGATVPADTEATATAAAAEFIDVPPTHVFYRDIMWLTSSGITTGYADGTYRPSAPVTRGQMGAFLARLWRGLGGPDDPAPDPRFSDVPPSHVFHKDIAWLADSGITLGYADGTFRPGASVSRQQMAAFIQRFWKATGLPVGPVPDPGFSDVPLSHLFHGPVAWLADSGITLGYADGTFRPGASVSRQQMAAFIHRLWLRIQEDNRLGKTHVLTTYAPQLRFVGFEAKPWYEPDQPAERYYPSSVEWTFPYVWRERIASTYWYVTRANLSEPSSVLDYFRGCDGAASRCKLDEVPIYAFFHRLDGSGYVDLNYFVFFPYNRGKEHLFTVWGNHVGDWERLSVRATETWDDVAGWTYAPLGVTYEAHGTPRSYLWDSVLRTGGTHPIVYVAWGSHGFWRTAGDHDYDWHSSDVTNDRGLRLDTWKRVEAFDTGGRERLVNSRPVHTHRLDGQPMPSWLGRDFGWVEGLPARTDPDAGHVLRFGNPERGECLPGVCRLEDGPTGPLEKGIW